MNEEAGGKEQARKNCPPSVATALMKTTVFSLALACLGPGPRFDLFVGVFNYDLLLARTAGFKLDPFPLPHCFNVVVQICLCPHLPYPALLRTGKEAIPPGHVAFILGHGNLSFAHEHAHVGKRLKSGCP